MNINNMKIYIVELSQHTQERVLMIPAGGTFAYLIDVETSICFPPLARFFTVAIIIATRGGRERKSSVSLNRTGYGRARAIDGRGEGKMKRTSEVYGEVFRVI